MAPALRFAPVALLLLAACSGSTESGKLAVGEDCGGEGSKCQSGLCHVVDTATSICTQACASNDDCPAKMLCDRVPVLGAICLPTGLGGRCRNDEECPAGHLCDAEAARCYIPVVRDLCAPCTSPKQCPEGGHCTTVAGTGEQYCSTGCGADGSCPAGFECQEVDGAPARQCIPANEGRTCSLGKSLCSPCRGDNECGAYGDLCVRNVLNGQRFCGRACSGDTDCPLSFGCQDLSGDGRGPFQCVPNSARCDAYCDSDDPEAVRRQCGLGASCDVQASTCEPATDGRLCSACEDDDGCPSADDSSRCVVNNCPDCPYKGQKFCSTSCSGAGGGKDDSKCPAGFFCVGLGAGGASGPWHCVPKSGTCRGGAGQLGDDCTALGAPACLSGICLGFGAQSVCSTACSNDAACGDPRFKCCAVVGEGGSSFDCTQAPGAAGGVCSPRGSTFGADCSPGQPPCFQGVCLDLGTARLCTTECPGGAACPEGFACRLGKRPKGDGTFEDVDVCFPDGGGSVGADCTFGPAACKSGYCVKKPSGNVCTADCSADASVCPDAWNCEQENTVDGEAVQVCLPADL